MFFIKEIIQKYKESKKEINEMCECYILKIDNTLEEYDTFFSNKQEFIEPCKVQAWCNNNSILFKLVSKRNIQKLKRAKKYKVLVNRQNNLFQKVNTLKQQVQYHNSQVTDLKIPIAYSLVGEVEGNRLDRQQMACIVKEVQNQLVIAGAGTGKTTTIIGKIKYLIKSGKYNPEDILVLSFTNASASEIKNRIKKEIGINIDSLTFHKLGLNIITKVKEIVPKITNLNLKKFINEQLLLNMQSEEYLNLLNNYLLYNRVISKSEFEFKTQSEYDEYIKLNPPTTINNEIVKSYGEMEIANFLTQNSIRYIYEAPYEFDTRTSEYGQYKPDFYLPDYNIYIEYFGINRNGEVPNYFKGKDELTATEVYQESINWKRKTHIKNNTNLIECYAYEKFEGKLLDNLKEKLLENSVNLVSKNPKELWKQISNEKDFNLDGVVELFETVINLVKSNNYTFEKLKELNFEKLNNKNNIIILQLLEPIFNAYLIYLEEQGEIDFNDMINIATNYVSERKFSNQYKYVIIDEYQDISNARFKLLNKLRENNYFNIFCVGDDWQSIYRFAGSDISYILNFEKYWGASEISKIENTYRFNQTLSKISGNFIMKNPYQIKKNIKGENESNEFPLEVINAYTNNLALEFMLKKIDLLPQSSTVYFIGRYSFDSVLLNNSSVFECKYNNITGIIDVKYAKRKDLTMHFITAHKSKGLQADYVFIINNKNSRMGFPSKIQEIPILKLLLEDYELYQYAEERRLFYVSLTRARKKVYLVTINNQESEFVSEIKKEYKEELKQNKFRCPLCGGKIIKKSGPYGVFFACSNYKTKGCTYKKNNFS